MEPCYLIYHPKRECSYIGEQKVYHDGFGGNEDPYIWNERFLHTYCHITQLTNNPGQINFWVSGDTFPDFNRLLCDCVFLIEKKMYWDDSNNIERNNGIVENDQTFKHHYEWANTQHPLKRRRRYTLKADADNSFQPQNRKSELIDVIPFLNKNGISLPMLRQGISYYKSGKRALNSRPYKLEPQLGYMLYEYLLSVSAIKILGRDIANKHPNFKYPTLSDKVQTKRCNC